MKKLPLAILATLLSFTLTGFTFLGFGGRTKAIRTDWNLAETTDNVDSYFNFISTWSRSSLYKKHQVTAENKFIRRLKGERNIEIRVMQGGVKSEFSPERDIAFLAYFSGLRNSEIILSGRGTPLSAKYISKNRGFWDRPKEIKAGGTLQGFFAIEGETAPIVKRRDFEFEVEPPSKIYGSGKTLNPAKWLYLNHLQVMLVDAFSRLTANRISFLLEVSQKSQYLSRSARAVLLYKDMAPNELRDARQLRHVIEVLQKSTDPTTRVLAACLLSYSDDPTAVQALIATLVDEGKVPSTGGLFFGIGGSFPVYKAAQDALAKIGEPAVAPLVSTFHETSDKSLREKIMNVFINDFIPAEHAIEALISFLASANRGEVKSASAARYLRSITGEDFGKDQEAWSNWWMTKQRDAKHVTGKWFENILRIDSSRDISQYLHESFKWTADSLRP